MPSGESAPSLRVVILGSDALLEARPATPIQVARACLASGYDFVAPVSWGEELLATRVIESVRDIAPPSSVIIHCPFVSEAIRQQNDVLPACWRSVSPPVATARYVRSAFSGRAVHVTYAGRCPGATSPDLDAVVLPQVLFGQLLEAGAIPHNQPKYFDELLPPDRSRYASLPGGVPEPAVLQAAAGARLREAAAATLRAVALSFESPEPVVIDLEVASGCVCARDRFAIAQLEPTRATSPVVVGQIAVSLAVRTEPRTREVPKTTRPTEPVEQPDTEHQPRAESLQEERPIARYDERTIFVARQIVEQSEAETLVTAMEPWVPPNSPPTPQETAAKAEDMPPRADPRGVDRTTGEDRAGNELASAAAAESPSPSENPAADLDDWFAPDPDEEQPEPNIEPAR